MFGKYFLIALTLLCGAKAFFGSMKNVTVIGRLYCGFGPARNVTIQLWEDDTVFGIGNDDMLNSTKTDYNGRFKIYGEKQELLNIEPYILVMHKCGKRHCDIIDRSDISDRYLGDTYDIGSVELSPPRKGRRKSCY